MSFSYADLVAAADVPDPRMLHEQLASGDPVAIQAMATSLGGAADSARSAVAMATRADELTAATYRMDGAGVPDAPAATAATRTALGAGGEHLAETARLLTDVAGRLGTAQAASGQHVNAMDAELRAVSDGHDPGSVLAALGGALMGVSTAGEAGGLALDATGVGAIVGVPLGALSAAGIATGAGITVAAVGNIASNASSGSGSTDVDSGGQTTSPSTGRDLPPGVKDGWEPKPARNGRGTVHQRPGAQGNEDSIRIADPDSTRLRPLLQ